jgi:Rieske Fe-S protein
MFGQSSGEMGLHRTIDSYPWHKKMCRESNHTNPEEAEMKDAKTPDVATLERRSFCIGAVGALGAISLASLACGGGGGGSNGYVPPQQPPPATGVVTTTESKSSMLAQPDGTVMHFGDGPGGCPNALGTKQGVFLAKDSGGIYAMDASCTHLGGLPVAGGSGFTCPCHGSTFDLNGAVTGGPASSSLQHYLVKETTTGGMLEVDTASVVSASTRLS